MTGRAKHPITLVPTRTLIWDPNNGRRRAAEYVGRTDDRGVTGIVLGLVARSLDEHMLGFGTRISVEVRDGFASVTDEGRGVQPRRRSLVKQLDTLALGGRFLGDYRARPGTRTGNWFRLPTAHLSAINAASDRFEVESHDGANSWAMAFERGTPTVALHRVGPSTATFTRFRFQPAPELFGTAKVDLAVTSGAKRGHFQRNHRGPGDHLCVMAFS
jgi:DNA gyrase subunit B